MRARARGYEIFPGNYITGSRSECAISRTMTPAVLSRSQGESYVNPRCTRVRTLCGDPRMKAHSDARRSRYSLRDATRF